jgi:hypothetical protein
VSLKINLFITFLSNKINLYRFVSAHCPDFTTAIVKLKLPFCKVKLAAEGIGTNYCKITKSVWSSAPKDLRAFQLYKKLSAFYGNHDFITY